MNVNPDLIARFPYTSLEQVADPEGFADLRALLSVAFNGTAEECDATSMA